MMKKVMLIVAMMMVWGMGVKDVKAECVRKVKNIDYVTNAVIETGEAKPVGVNKAICDYTPTELGTVDGAMHYRKHYTVLVCGEDNKLSEIPSDYAIHWRWETTPIRECTGNCVENSDGTVGCTNLVKCETYNGNSVEDRTWGCASANSYGVCNGATGTFENVESCFDGSFCNDGRWVGDGQKKYECKASSCEKEGVAIPEGEKRCAGGDVWACTAGKSWLADECDGSQCVKDDLLGWVCTGTDATNVNTCGQIDDGNGGTKSTGNTVALAGRSVCYNNQIYTCNSLPTFTTGKDCSKMPNGQTTCCTYTIGGLQDAKCDTAAKCDPATNPNVTSQWTTNSLGETTVTTNVYNPLCSDGKSISTAFGCIPYDAPKMVAKLLQILFGVAGGIAFLLMVYGFILVATSSGDEKKLQAAKETITSAITGLLISIFALFLFRLIVVNILQIPLG